MLWVGTLIGVIARSPDVVQGIAFLVIFPLTFVATTFVPVAGLPDGLRQVAEYNPVSCWAAAVRTLFGNPTATPTDAGWPLSAPGPRLGPLVPGDPRRRRPPDPARLPPPHHRLSPRLQAIVPWPYAVRNDQSPMNAQPAASPPTPTPSTAGR